MRDQLGKRMDILALRGLVYLDSGHLDINGLEQRSRIKLQEENQLQHNTTQYIHNPSHQINQSHIIMAPHADSLSTTNGVAGSTLKATPPHSPQSHHHPRIKFSHAHRDQPCGIQKEINTLIVFPPIPPSIKVIVIRNLSKPYAHKLNVLRSPVEHFINDVFPKWAEKIKDVFGYEMVLPMNTGAEAVETAIKIARKWAYKVKGVEKDKALILLLQRTFMEELYVSPLFNYRSILSLSKRD
ncbi:hypothetical protein EYC84_004510 [Monilinia fructicola]|uniref:Ornithine aminotransferase n=1 Tax=Monilinia fructicola TaxID=38448 RepID=A0A5M9K0L4_MONFR|nr:hypothetical protein EYC84_004510 [Monilinia fructicola]